MKRNISRHKLLTALTLFALMCNCVLINVAHAQTPSASFTASPVTGCAPLNVVFTNTSANAVSYYWDFGNGNTSTLANPSNIYSLPGSYTVTLIATSGSGISDTLSLSNLIYVDVNPVAAFMAPITTGCANTTFTFINNSVNATSWLWDFGDGNTSTLQNPTHNYINTGNYTIQLIAYSTGGCSNLVSQTNYIHIYQTPTPTITSNVQNTCNPNQVISFNGAAPGATSWHWDFGDGFTSSQQNPNHVYGVYGTFNVTLIAYNAYGCSDTLIQNSYIHIDPLPQPSFTANVVNGCAPMSVGFTSTVTGTITSYSWNFGDNSISSGPNPAHNYSQPGNYTVTLTVTNSIGCTASASYPNYISVYTTPTASFTISDTLGCKPLPVQFTNTSTNASSYSWNFGDGGTSTQANPSYTYVNGGLYSVTLTAISSGGCTASFVHNAAVNVTAPIAVFNGYPRAGCSPLTVNFANSSNGNNLSYFWNFGDGNTDTTANPTHTYNNPGNYNVTLIAVDSIGCRDTLIRTNYVQVNNPTATFVPQPTTVGCAPLSTQLTDNTPGAVAWYWDFGDGFTSTLQSPSHVYTTAGFYTVQLTITFNGGCVQTISTFSTFDVRTAEAGFTVTVSPCPPYTAVFTDTSHNVVSWFWTFGDGGTSNQQNPTHIYGSPGYYNVTLTVTSTNGCSHTIMVANAVYCPPFGASFTSVPQGTTYPLTVDFFANSVGATGWFWDFGDGGTSTQENPTYTYNVSGSYTVTLTITNGTCTITYTTPPLNLGTDTVSGPPLPGGSSPQPQVGCAPLTVTFTQAPANTVAWHWDFGDGDTSNVQYPTHTYGYPGVYNITLTAWDASGSSQQLFLPNYVYASGPVAHFGLTQSASCLTSIVSFVDSSSNAAHWSWTFGDGGTDTVQNPTHAYAGSFANQIVTLTVSDTNGCSNSVSRLIVSNFIGSIVASQPEVCANDTVSFITSFQYYNSYLWDFGDGNYSSSLSPSHAYVNPGSYFVTLTVTDAFGCSQSFTSVVPVDVLKPVAGFSTVGPHDGCDNLTVNFVNNSTGSTNYFWDFGDGNNSTAINPIHTYNSAGTYTVTLTAYNGICSSTIVMPNYIAVHTITASFSINQSSQCMPITANFTDLTGNSVWWYWRFGDNSVSSAQNPTHTYTTLPNDSVRLTVRDAFGCTSNATANISIFSADFNVTLHNGCSPLTTNFTDISHGNAISWWWDFGDGNTSTSQNPSHTYLLPGSFTITFVATSASGCSDTIVAPNWIQVYHASAGFTASTTTACAPALISFTDQSVNAVSWEWDFGDGATSVLQNPSHIYNTPGLYTVQLIAHSSNGCSDTIIKPNYITVLGPITNFTVSSLSGCNPFTAAFTDLSVGAVAWQWNFGDGNNSSSQNPNHVYADTGSFTITLITWDSAGCSSFFTLPQLVVVHPTPQALFTVSASSLCTPVTVQFTNSSTGFDNMFWDFGDGNTSAQINPSHIYNVAGTYTVYAIASTQFGCADTFVLPLPIIVNQSPVAAFSVTTPKGCPPLMTSFINQSAYMSGATFAWDLGNLTSSTQVNPPAAYINPGYYSVTLIVTNPNGCSDTLVEPSLIQVYDTVPPPISPILSVSVSSNTTVDITWLLNTATDLQAYVLYRLDQSTGNYNVIYTDTNVSNTSMALTNTYTDHGLNTLANTYTYKLLTLDRCNYAIPLDSLTAHTTINVSAQTMTANVLVSWNSYGGCPISSYKIFRSSPFSTAQLIATVSPSTLTYLDTTLDCPYNYSYKIMATDLCGNNYVSYSDTAVGTPVNIYVGQQPNVVRSTVVNNESILTEWQAPVVQPGSVVQYDIYRSTDNVNFSHIATVPAAQTDYMDYNVEVQKQNYFYRVDVINMCNIQAIISNDGSSILLTGDKLADGGVQLNWTDYIGWSTGVDHYIIERRDDNGSWYLLGTVPGNITSYQDH